MLYIDTSAFLKLIVEEDHSKDLQRYLTNKELWSSTLLGVEAHRAGLRLGIAPTDIDLRLAFVTMFVPSETTFDTARLIGSASLPALDAIHLSSAAELGGDLDALVTYDRRLREACPRIGMAVVAPGAAAL